MASKYKAVSMVYYVLICVFLDKIRELC